VPRRPHRTDRPHTPTADRPTKDLAVKWTKTPCACRSLRNRIIGWVRRSDEEARVGPSRPSSSIDGCTIVVQCRRPRRHCRIVTHSNPLAWLSIRIHRVQDYQLIKRVYCLSFTCPKAMVVKTELVLLLFFNHVCLGTNVVSLLITVYDD